MVSKTMAESLDRLNSAISKAESRLARLPQAWAVEYGFDEDWDGYFMALLEIDGEPRLCRYAPSFEPSSGLTRDEERPISDLPVHARRRCAEAIPAFTDLCIEEEADYAKGIDEAADDIDAAISRLS